MPEMSRHVRSSLLAQKEWAQKEWDCLAEMMELGLAP